MPFRPLQAQTVNQETTGFRSFEKPAENWKLEQEIPDSGGSGILSKAGEITGGLFKGFGKGMISTAVGLSSLTERGLRALLPKFAEEAFDLTGSTVAEELVPEEFREPEGTAEKIGFTAEKIAEFLLPSSKISALKGLTTAKIGKLGISAGQKTALEIGAKGLIEAGTTGGITAIQRGKYDKTAKVATLIGGLFGIGSAGISKLLAKAGQKIQVSQIKPSVHDLQDGFDVSNVSKYGVGGSLPETATKTHIEINKRASELSQILRGSKAKVDMAKVFDETMDELSKTKVNNFGDLAGIKRVSNSLKGELDAVGVMDGKLGLMEATNVKRGAGTKGAWVFGRFDPDAKATEVVYNTFYNKLKTAIEKSAEGLGSRIKMLNKEMSELIPISNAVIRRIPIDQRNNILSLTDTIGLFGAIFDPKALALIGVNQLSKSAKFGNFLVKVSGLSEKLGTIGVRTGMGIYEGLEK